MIAMILYLALLGQLRGDHFPASGTANGVVVNGEFKAGYRQVFEGSSITGATVSGFDPVPPIDVPAIQEERPSPYPCNLSSGPFAVCITGPEKVWTCQDKSRVLLISEDGVRHCIRF